MTQPIYPMCVLSVLQYMLLQGWSDARVDLCEILRKSFWFLQISTAKGDKDFVKRTLGAIEPPDPSIPHAKYLTHMFTQCIAPMAHGKHPEAIKLRNYSSPIKLVQIVQ